ncbi:unnamed protein product [Linum tenue]|uniref:CCHC-type domain-containing protein n=1 Tax=Linum tenue TaxID=586396 RepID=A0AAV0MLZ9_9ROSI|nr:unnamed protein product [Linum tenue]
MFLDEYIPDSIRDDKREEFMKLKQEWGQTVAEYTEQFKKLCKYADPAYRTAIGMRDRYIRGLKAEIKKCMGEAERVSQPIAYRAALRIEKDEKMAQEERTARFDVRKRKESTYSGSQTLSTHPSKRGPGSTIHLPSHSMAGSNRSAPTQYPLCKFCEKHHSGVCRFKLGLCFGCGQPGHKKANCPRFTGHTMALSEPSIGGGRMQSGGRFNDRATTISNTHNNHRDQSQMSKASGQPRLFAMGREEANAAPEVVTGAARNQELVDHPQVHSCCSGCHQRG